jgi:hypothetical protein
VTGNTPIAATPHLLLTGNIEDIAARCRGRSIRGRSTSADLELEKRR